MLHVYLSWQNLDLTLDVVLDYSQGGLENIEAVAKLAPGDLIQE